MHARAPLEWDFLAVGTKIFYPFSLHDLPSHHVSSHQLSGEWGNRSGFDRGESHAIGWRKYSMNQKKEYE